MLAALRACLDNDSTFHHTVVLIGSTADEALAREWGINSTDRIAAPLSHPELAWTALRRLAANRAKPDVIHAWSAPCARLANRAKLACPFTVTLDGTAIESKATGLFTRRAIRAAAAVHYTCSAVLDLWAPYLDPNQPHTVAPLPIFPNESSTESRQRIRDRYPIDNDTTLIFAAGEPASAIDARYLAYTAGLLTLSGIKAAILLPVEAAELERALRWTQRHQDRWPLITDTLPIHKLIPACDAAVWSRGRWPSLGSRLGGHRHTGAESLAWAAAAAIPIIAERQPESTAALHHAAPATLIDLTRPLDLPTALLHLIENHQQPRTDARTLQRIVLEQRTPKRFANALRQILILAPLSPALTA